MIGVVIVAHGGLAGEFRAALEHVVGRQERLEDFSIGPEDDVEQRRVELIDAGGDTVFTAERFGGRARLSGVEAESPNWTIFTIGIGRSR